MALRRSRSPRHASWIFLGIVFGALILGATLVIISLFFRSAIMDTVGNGGDDSTSQDEISALRSEIEGLRSEISDGANSAAVDEVGGEEEKKKLEEVVTKEEEIDVVASGVKQNILTFDFSEVSVGDAVGPFRISSLKPYVSSRAVSETNAIMSLDGTINARVLVEYFDDNAEYAGQVCVTEFLDEDEDDHKGWLPVLEGRGALSSPYLCFNNTNVSQRLFGPVGSEHEALVTIQDLELQLERSNVIYEGLLLHAENIK